MVRVNPELEQARVMTKVARLYHTRGMRQTEIARTLGISQARVSRLLSAAEAAGVVRTIVVVPEGLNADLEEALEDAYGLLEVHVVDALGSTEAGLTEDLGTALASVVATLPLEGKTIGFTSWSRSLRRFAAEFSPLHNGFAERVIEMLGGVGPPAVQHEATVATQRLAQATGAEASFLRVPGVVASAAVREAILSADPHARAALTALGDMDIALVGIGNCEIVAPLEPGDNFFSIAQFDLAKSRGAVGQVNLRFVDAFGNPVSSELDDLVIGVTREQLLGANRRIGVAGGPSKYAAIRAAVLGGWVNVLVTDTTTAEHLLERASGSR